MTQCRAASGRRDYKPELGACLEAFRADDTLLGWKFDRLGRTGTRSIW